MILTRRDRVYSALLRLLDIWEAFTDAVLLFVPCFWYEHEDCTDGCFFYVFERVDRGIDADRHGSIMYYLPSDRRTQW